ncbi:MAG: hypothetical protein AAGF56_10590, partial [Pseudomonadota bacterium]
MFGSSQGFDRKQIFVISGTGIAAFTVAGLSLLTAQGFDSRFDTATNNAFRAAEGNPYRERCMGLRERAEL